MDTHVHACVGVKITEPKYFWNINDINLISSVKLHEILLICA